MNLSGPIFIYAKKQIYPISPENQENILRHSFIYYNGMILELYCLTIFSQTQKFQAINYLVQCM